MSEEEKAFRLFFYIYIFFNQGTKSWIFYLFVLFTGIAELLVQEAAEISQNDTITKKLIQQRKRTLGQF